MPKNPALRINAMSEALLTRNRKITQQHGKYWRAGVTALVLAASTIMFTSFLWGYGSIPAVNLQYQISQAQETKKELLEMNRKLRIELSSLTAISRLERLAIETYGMGPPQSGHVMYVP
jgi:cell division protein FtsL